MWPTTSLLLKLFQQQRESRGHALQGTPWVKAGGRASCGPWGWQSPAPLAGWAQETPCMLRGTNYATTVSEERVRGRIAFYPQN